MTRIECRRARTKPHSRDEKTFFIWSAGQVCTMSVAAVAVMGCELEAHCTRVQILETAIW